MQEAWAGYGEDARLITLPDEDEEVIPGVTWGCPGQFNTPAYWAVRCLWEADLPAFISGNDLVREIAFCLLGGFGIRYEINVAAYERLEQRGYFDRPDDADAAEIRLWLAEPLVVDGKRMRYRFPNQRARRIAKICKFTSERNLDNLSALELRAALLELEGIGPKTASWIVRNLLGSDEVAILDVHLIRACQQMRVFPHRLALPKDYDALEERFLSFSHAIRIRPSVLDAVIWSEARASNARSMAR